MARLRFTVLAVSAVWLLSCSGAAEPKGPNVACFRALDCQNGLVCVEGRCTADLTPIVPEPAATVQPAAPVPNGDGGPD